MPCSREPSACSACRQRRYMANRAAGLACDHGGNAPSTLRIPGGIQCASSRRAQSIRVEWARSTKVDQMATRIAPIFKRNFVFQKYHILFGNLQVFQERSDV